jgi:S1-C subfamily serine protease
MAPSPEGDPPTVATLGTLITVSGESPEAGGFGADDPNQNDGETDGLRGWIPPEDRLWRHPSEVGSPGAGPSALTGDPHRPNAWVVGGLTLCAVGVLLIAGLAMATSGASPGASNAVSTSTLAAKLSPPTTEPGRAHLLSTTDEAHALAAVLPSLVALTVNRAGGWSSATGIAAESGGVIVTTMAAVAGATSVAIRQSDGTRQSVQMVGNDPTSGIQVMRVGNDLPVATFDLSDPTPGSTAMAVALAAGTRASTPPASVYAGTVLSSGTAIVGGGGPTAVFAPTVVDAPLGPGDRGGALLDGQGQVVGVLATTTSDGSGPTAVFLPSSLVLGVTQQLVSMGHVDRGWLGVPSADTASASADTASATGASAAVLDSITPGGAAAHAGLQVGDAIVAVDGRTVHSMAELRSRLYADLPGTSLMVTFVRTGVQRSTPVVLSSVDTDASDTGASP